MTVSLMTGHAPIAAEILSRDELLALAGYEQTIERGFKTFVEVGTALAQIHEQRLYRAQHATFEEYCEARWDFTGRRGRQLIEAAAIGRILPIANAGQAAELAKVPEAERAEVLAEATERADGKPTAKVIAEVVKERTEPDFDLRAAVLAKLPRTEADAMTVLRLHKKIGAGTPNQVREMLRVLVAERVVRPARLDGADRYWLAPEPAPEAEVLRALATYGAVGATAWQVAFLLDAAGPPADAVTERLYELADAGQVVVVSQTSAGPLWALAELVDDETPEPAAADAPAVVAGSGSTSPEPEPEVLPARRPAPRLIAEVTELVDELVTHPDQVTPEMVAALREQADRLEQVLGGAA